MSHGITQVTLPDQAIVRLGCVITQLLEKSKEWELKCVPDLQIHNVLGSVTGLSSCSLPSPDLMLI